MSWKIIPTSLKGGRANTKLPEKKAFPLSIRWSPSFWYSYYQYKLSNFPYRNLKSKHALSQVKHVNPSGVNQPRNKNILYTKRQTLFCIFHCAASKIIVHDLLLFVNQSFISLWMFTVSIDLSFKWAPR